MRTPSVRSASGSPVPRLHRLSLRTVPAGSNDGNRNELSWPSSNSKNSCSGARTSSHGHSSHQVNRGPAASELSPPESSSWGPPSRKMSTRNHGGDYLWEVKLNDIGWRPRWFILQDGVLSYFKIHGPDGIESTLSIRLLSRRRQCYSHQRRKPIGEVHLKVSSIRESRSDDKRFSIFTGTKRLHLSKSMTSSVKTLRQLEYEPAFTEKVDLENTFVDESQRQLKEDELSSRSRLEKDSGSFKSTESEQQLSSVGSDEDDIYGIHFVDDKDTSLMTGCANYPYVRRRRKLPVPIEKEKGDLTKVCLPVFFNEPLSSLQKCFEDLEYSYLIDRAYEWGKNSLCCIGYASTEKKLQAFNPLLGETYEADYPDKGIRFISEKFPTCTSCVSHHPMVVACHCEGGMAIVGDSNLKSKSGPLHSARSCRRSDLEFDDGRSSSDDLHLQPHLGKLYCDHYGTMRIQGSRQYSCKIKFKEQSIIDRNPHQVQGIVQDRSGRTVATLFEVGREHAVRAMVGEGFSSKGKGPPEPPLLSETAPSCGGAPTGPHPTRYKLTRFAITLNELTPELKRSCRSRTRAEPDQSAWREGEYMTANAEKLRLEQRQRQRGRCRRGVEARCFARDKGGDTYRYVGGYWEARRARRLELLPRHLRPGTRRFLPRLAAR
ncbi:unnamed protein product [Spirodela intermedia]|uniref:PH domain-containing protein n=1 Tax=Spirodela intermedia TaxID=51605 RepID=A0ABN7EDM9_SPIIN|nr:unnamed protein product [Spirodela intermedia]